MTQLLDSTAATLAPGVWDIDPGHSNVEFVVRHLLSRVRGRFTDFTGSIEVGDDRAATAISVTIQAASIDTNHAGRDEHLRNPDFLDTGRFPTLSFRSTAIGAGDNGRLAVEGELTIRDVTRPVTLDVEFLGAAADPWGGTRSAFSARAEIDRDEFGAGWDMPLDAGGVLMGKKVAIELEVEAILRTP